LRMIILRKTPDVTEAARTALRRVAIKNGQQLDPRSLIAAEFMVLGTSPAAHDCPADEVLAVYRLRSHSYPHLHWDIKESGDDSGDFGMNRTTAAVGISGRIGHGGR